MPLASSPLSGALPVPLRRGLWIESSSGLRRIGAKVSSDFFRGHKSPLGMFVVTGLQQNRGLPVPMLADAVIAVDESRHRLIVDAKLGLIYREMSQEDMGSCRELRKIWESRVMSSRVLHWTDTGQIETIIRGKPISRLDTRHLNLALHSAVRQLISLKGTVELGTSEEHVRRGLCLLEIFNQHDNVKLLEPLVPALCRAPLVPAGSDNSPHNALFCDGEAIFIDVCPVTPLPLFVRPIGLIASWAAGMGVNIHDCWDAVVRTEVQKVFPISACRLDERLIVALTSLAVACDGTLDLSIEGAVERFQWLHGAYKL